MKETSPFSKYMLESSERTCTLIGASFTTPLGTMFIVADAKGVYLCEFEERKKLDTQVESLKKRCNSTISSGTNIIISRLKEELKLYFSGKLTSFNTKVHLQGTPFQIEVLKALQKIPYGKTVSYLEEAYSMGKESAVRAVANANGRNPLAIIIPCHRVITSSGRLGGYGGGIEKKKWLLHHEGCTFKS